jgi:NAD(P)-dependent dehydrogenase (short-subunit alcohol dehydrogenase family)
VSELRFDGRVAVVTGAGRALGRAHALLLAERGASVLVNDLGTERDGSGADASLASAVAQEIVDLGGQAVANNGDVGDPEAAHAMVAAAVERFGRLDVVINNAGIMTHDDFGSVPLEQFERTMRVNLGGAFNVTQAAWPHLVSQGYGRVVMTVSAGMLGAAPIVSYASAKAGLVGLTRTVAQAGAPHGILVNAFAPAAITRLVGDPEIRKGAGLPLLGTTHEGKGQPEEVVPAGVFLAHESCPVTGEIFTSTGSCVARLFIGATRGYTERGMSLETIRDHWGEICDESVYFVPRTTAEYHAKRAEYSL